MTEWYAYLWGLLTILLAALGAWLHSLRRNKVSIVDSLWPLLFLIAALTYAATSSVSGPRLLLMVVLVGVWALRLSAYITWRNWGGPEDRRYQAIRANHEPHFAVKSLFIVFGFQGLLAWFISLPLLAAIAGQQALNIFDMVGILLWLIGLVFEAGGDYQLAQFKADPTNRGRVMDSGLWRYTRHPNYFGDACIWWGFYLLATAAGGWWSIPAPVLMTFLLLRVSGVALLEKDIGERRPAYRAYIARTNAFFPGPRKPAPHSMEIDS
jgi:steroid 5-alpha reductase family enzyme